MCHSVTSKSSSTFFCPGLAPPCPALPCSAPDYHACTYMRCLNEQPSVEMTTSTSATPAGHCSLMTKISCHLTGPSPYCPSGQMPSSFGRLSASCKHLPIPQLQCTADFHGRHFSYWDPVAAHNFHNCFCWPEQLGIRLWGRDRLWKFTTAVL